MLLLECFIGAANKNSVLNLAPFKLNGTLKTSGQLLRFSSGMANTQ